METQNSDKIFPIDKIEETLDILHPNFSYRPNQRETIVSIVDSFINDDNKYIVLDAPTGCFVGNTKIRLLDGTTKEIQELVGKRDFYVVSCNKDGDIVPGKVLDVWETKITDDLVKVTLDDGSYSICTSDHKFMLRDGSYCKASNLEEGISLMPLYIENRSCGRNYIYNPKDNRYLPLFHQIMKGSKPKERKKFNLHHIDFNKLNDSPDNLEWLTIPEHSRIHTNKFYSECSDEERAKRTKGLIDSCKNSEIQSRRSRKSWYDENGIKRNKKIEISRKTITSHNKSEKGRNISRLNSEYMRYTSKWKIDNLDGYKKYRSNCGKIPSLRKILSDEEFKTFMENMNYEKERFKKLSKQCINSGMLTKLEFEKLNLKNHKVKSVEPYNQTLPVYDMEIETYHNFAIETSKGSGVIVHNSGKSHIAFQTGEVLNNYYTTSTLIVTKTIALQDQYVKTFSSMRKLMGASNYKCSSKSYLPIPPSQKYHEDCKYTKSSNLCEYNKARRLFKTARFKCLNYAFYITGLAAYKADGIFIIDESHNFEDTLLELVTLEVCIENLDKEKIAPEIKLSDYWYKHSEYNLKTLDRNDCIALLKFVSDKIDVIFDFVNQKDVEISDIESMYNEDDELSDIDYNKVVMLNDELKYLKNKLSTYSKMKFCFNQMINSSNFERDWVVYKDDKKTSKKSYIIIKPIEIPRGIVNKIFENCRKVLFMSATALRVAKSLGFDDNQVKTIQVPYIFDLKNRPIYALTNMPLFNKLSREKVLPDYVNIIDEIISQYPKDTNFLIHSVSYDNAKNIKNNSKNKSRVFIPDSKQLRNIKKFVKTGFVTVSPAMLEGIDMDEGLARVQIFLKVPFPYLGDRWVVKKKDYDPEWYKYKTMIDIIQGSGRGIRSENDKCDTIILDPSFKSVYYSVPHLIPEWWKKTVNFL